MSTEKLTLAEQYDALTAAYAEARDAKAGAKDRLRIAKDAAATEVTADLRSWCGKDPLRPSYQRDQSKAAEHAELSTAFCEAVIERGLLLEPVSSANGWAVSVSHPGGSDEVDAATEAEAEARAAVRDFEEEHGEALTAERVKAEATELQELLATDPAGFRAAVNGDSGAAALTSDDLAPTRSRVTRAG